MKRKTEISIILPPTNKPFCFRLVMLGVCLAIGIIAPKSAQAATFNVLNNNDSGPGSLRSAILNANSNPGPDKISFLIATTDKTITLLTALPVIIDTVLIDGWSQGGSSYQGPPLVGLRFPGGVPDGICLNLSGDNPKSSSDSVIRGLLITQCGGYGIVVFVDRITIQGCYIIGTNSGSSKVLGGITLFSSHNQIGGSTVSLRNVISGNYIGLLVEGEHTRVEGNYIGLDFKGNPLGNSSSGVVISGSHNTIGGTFLAQRNFICANDEGVTVAGSNNSLENNYIGVGADGATNAGNKTGVHILLGNNNIIGGTAQFPQLTISLGNAIAFNSGKGILIDQGTGNLISRNSIYDNHGNGLWGADLGIDLKPLGVTLNDECDTDAGTNHLQNFPVINSVIASASKTLIQGTAFGQNINGAGTFALEFFANPSCSSSGHGQGKTFIGSTTVSIPVGSCSASFNTSFNVVLPVGTFVTATAIDAQNNTSEFSQCTLALIVPGG